MCSRSNERVENQTPVLPRYRTDFISLDPLRGNSARFAPVGRTAIGIQAARSVQPLSALCPIWVIRRCQSERRPPRLDLTVYPYLPRASVATTSAKAYLDLLAGAAS